ncbi:MAG: MCE family protein [Verrucomicrobia bacterium]|nr:MAG: MCE family protein [Verrucomicrobiota bacterium]
MKNTLETRLGIFVALAVIAIVLILEAVGGFEQFQSGYRVYALFKTVQDLKVGDRVKMGGVEIGRVTDIKLTNNQAMVVMKLRDKPEVRAGVQTDSKARVTFTGLMGQNFVSIEFGGRAPNAKPIEKDQYIETVEQPDLSAMMTKIDNVAEGVQSLTRSFTGIKLDQLLGPLLDFVKENKGNLSATISNIQAVTYQVREGSGAVHSLLYSNDLYDSAFSTFTNLNDSAAEIKMTVADARKIVDQVNSGQGTIGRLVKEDTLYREATNLMVNLREISQKVNNGQGSVGKIINDQEFYRNAKLTLQKLDQATEGLEDQGPLSVLGTAISKLF